MKDQLLKLDTRLFKLVNADWHNRFFDWLMPWLRTPMFWSPLYIFILVFILSNVKKNRGLLILFALLTVILTDQVSSTLIKGNIHRLRPCAEEAIAAWRRALVGCGGNSSFTSSHAANHFGLAFFLYKTLKEYLGRWVYLFFIWAFIVCYSQVYVGVHYPGDVICGGIVGILIGMFTTYFYSRVSINNVRFNM